MKRLLKSAKFWTAVLAVVALVAGSLGLPKEVVREYQLAVAGLAAAVISGIALEDAAAKRAGRRPDGD